VRVPRRLATAAGTAQLPYDPREVLHFFHRLDIVAPTATIATASVSVSATTAAADAVEPTVGGRIRSPLS
jgi:hypothetical protein